MQRFCFRYDFFKIFDEMTLYIKTAYPERTGGSNLLAYQNEQ
jgi:hypothetical protein